MPALHDTSNQHPSIAARVYSARPSLHSIASLSARTSVLPPYPLLCHFVVCAPSVHVAPTMLSMLSRRVGHRAFHTARSLRMADAATTDAAAAGQFKWQHLVTPYTSAEFVDRMKGIEQSLQAMKAELVGVPDKIEPISWSDWEQKIDDKAAVGEIKSSYEQLKFEAAKGTDVTELTAGLDKAISKTSESEKVIGELLTAYKAELAAAKKEKVDIHNWHFHDYLARYPGLAEQMREQYMQGYQLPSDAEDRLAESDVGEMRRQVKAGGRIVVDDELPTRIGDWDYEVEVKKVEELARKLYADSPRYKEIQDQLQKDSQIMKKVEAGHAEAHH